MILSLLSLMRTVSSKGSLVKQVLFTVLNERVRRVGLNLSYCDTSLKNEALILVKVPTLGSDYKLAFPPVLLFLNCIDI